MKKFKSVDELIGQLQPEKPVYCIRKKSIQIASKFFQERFPGKILYAVKTNPNKEVLKTIIKSGIKQFDVASVEEIKTIKKLSIPIPFFGPNSVYLSSSSGDFFEIFFFFGFGLFIPANLFSSNWICRFANLPFLPDGRISTHCIPIYL